jgi:uncharacterized protein with HEPN domain
LSFKLHRQWLKDILEAVTRIERYTAGMDLEQFRQSPMVIDAVERNFQKISEAAIRLGEQAPALCPGIPWHNVRGMGNWLRHQYDAVELELIWLTVTDKIPALKVAVTLALDTGKPEPSAWTLIEKPLVLIPVGFWRALRDHMTDLELVFTMLGEKSTTGNRAGSAAGLCRYGIRLVAKRVSRMHLLNIVYCPLYGVYVPQRITK